MIILSFQDQSIKVNVHSKLFPILSNVLCHEDVMNLEIPLKEHESFKVFCDLNKILLKIHHMHVANSTWMHQMLFKDLKLISSRFQITSLFSSLEILKKMGFNVKIRKQLKYPYQTQIEQKMIMPPIGKRSLAERLQKLGHVSPIFVKINLPKYHSKSLGLNYNILVLRIDLPTFDHKLLQFSLYRNEIATPRVDIFQPIIFYAFSIKDHRKVCKKYIWRNFNNFVSISLQYPHDRLLFKYFGALDEIGNLIENRSIMLSSFFTSVDKIINYEYFMKDYITTTDSSFFDMTPLQEHCPVFFKFCVEFIQSNQFNVDVFSRVFAYFMFLDYNQISKTNESNPFSTYSQMLNTLFVEETQFAIFSEFKKLVSISTLSLSDKRRFSRYLPLFFADLND